MTRFTDAINHLALAAALVGLAIGGLVVVEMLGRAVVVLGGGR